MVFLFFGIFMFYENVEAQKFPPTSITNRYSSSSYATSKNAFKGSLKGQCTWYAYARVIELAERGSLDRSIISKMERSFMGGSNRHAKNWPKKLGGTWKSGKGLAYNERKPGMLVVWDSGNEHGHVAFLEEVSSDRKSFKVSHFNMNNDKTYHVSRWYPFDGPSLFKSNNVYPRFYALPVKANLKRPNPPSNWVRSINGTSATIEWDAVPNATHYRVYIASSRSGWTKDAGFKNSRYKVAEPKVGTTSYTFRGSPGKTYYYTVRVNIKKDNKQAFSECSQIKQFTLKGGSNKPPSSGLNPPRDIKVAGARGSGGISFNQMRGITSYRIQISTSKSGWSRTRGFSRPLVNTTRVIRRSGKIAYVHKGRRGTYYVSVQVRDSKGRKSSYSTPRSFTIR